MTTSTIPSRRHPFTHTLFVEDLVWHRFAEGVRCDGFLRLVVDGTIEFGDLGELAELPSKIYDPIKEALDRLAQEDEESDRRERADLARWHASRRG